MDVEKQSSLSAPDNSAVKSPSNMTSNGWLETQGQAHNFVVLLPTVLFMLFCGWYIVHFARRAATFDAGFLLCAQMMLCILAVYTDLVGYSVLRTFDGALALLGSACFLGMFIGEWMLKTMELKLRTHIILTIGFFTSIVWDLLKVGACIRKGQFSAAELVFIVSLTLKASLTTLADLSVRSMATDTTIRAHASRHRVGNSKNLAHILAWWLDSRLFKTLKNLLRVDALPDSELELFPSRFEKAFLIKYRENWRTKVLGDSPPRYFAMFWRETFMLIVPFFMISGGRTAIIAPLFKIIALSAWGWETNIALNCFCAAVSWVGGRGLSVVRRRLTERLMNLLRDSHQMLIDEATEVLESMGPRKSARRLKAKKEQQELEELLDAQKRLEKLIPKLENDLKWICRACTVLLLVAYLFIALDMELRISYFLLPGFVDSVVSR